MPTLRKVFTYSVVVATIIWSLGIAAVVPSVSAAYTPVAGDLIKTATDSAVYYIDAEGKRHLFVNEVTYWTWYSGTWATQNVKTISQADFDNLQMGSHVTVRPGTKLIRFQNSPRAYAVLPGGVLAHVTDEAAAKALYGNNWLSRLITIQNGFESNYSKTGGELTASSNLPDGSLIQYSGSEDIWYVEDGQKRRVTDDAFVANKFKDSDVIKGVSTAISYTTGESITSEIAAISTVAGPGAPTSPIASGSSLSVALASNTPAAGLAVTGAIRVPFTTISLTAAADGDITVDSVTVQRVGPAVDANFDSVALIDADTNVQIGLNQNLNASSKAVFSNDFVVKAGTTKRIILAGNMESTGSYAGQVPSLALADIQLKSGASVIGSLPITGNYQTMTALAIGGITVQRGIYQQSTTTEVKAGTTSYTIGALKISADSVEGQRVKQIKFYQGGTAAWDDLSNYQLLVDNATPVAATFTKDGKYLTADFTSNSVLIEKGKTKEFVLKADITGGSTRTIKVSVYRTTDILASGDTFGYMNTPTYSGTGSSAASPVMTNDQLTISAGSLRIESSNVIPASDVSYGDGQELGAFNFVVQGEPVDITELTLAISSSTAASDTFDNVKLVDANGSTLWGPSSPTSGSVAYTSSQQIPVGTNVIKVVADIKSTGGFANNETFYFTITGSTVTATGASTNETVTATPTGAVNAYTMTFKPGKLTVTANSLPVSGNVSLGAKDHLYGSWVFNAAASGEDVKITAITIANQTATTTNLDSVSLYDVTNKTNCTTKYPNATLDATYGCKLMVKDGYSGTTTWTLTDSIVITKNTSVTLELRADVRATAATYQGHKDGFVIRNDGSSAPVTAVGVLTGNTITPTGTAYDSESPVIMTIVGAGTLTINTSASAPASKLLAEGQTYEIGRLRLTATNEPIDVTDLSICIGKGDLTSTGDGTFTDVSNIKVYKATDMVNPIIDSPMNAVCDAFALTSAVNVPTGSSGIELVIKGTTAMVDNSAINEPGTANVSFKVGLGGTDGVTAKGATSGLTVTSITHSASTSSGMVLHKSYPVVTINSVTNSLTSGAVLYDFTVSNPNPEAVAVYRLSFHVSTTTGTADVTLGGLQAKLTGWSVFKKIAADSEGTFINGADDRYFTFALWNPDSTSQTSKELQIGGGQSAQFQFIGRTVVGTGGTTKVNVSTRLLGDTASSTLSTAYATGAPADAFSSLNQGNFVWSDLYENLGSTSNGASTTNQWYNGYLVDGLAATSSIVTVTE